MTSIADLLKKAKETVNTAKNRVGLSILKVGEQIKTQAKKEAETFNQSRSQGVVSPLPLPKVATSPLSNFIRKTPLSPIAGLFEPGKELASIGQKISTKQPLSPSEKKAANEYGLNVMGGFTTELGSAGKKMPTLKAAPPSPTRLIQPIIDKTRQTFARLSGSPIEKSLDVSLADSIPDSVKKVIDVLQEAKPLNKTQRVLYSQERGKRIGQAFKIGENVPGEKGFIQQLSKLKGELPKVEFESLRPSLTQEDIDDLFNRVRQSDLSPFDQISASGALAKIFGKGGGNLPTPSEQKLLRKTFGDEFVKVIRSKRSIGEKLTEAGVDVLNIPRSIMASIDLSAPLRQGAFLVGRPKQWIPAFKEMFKHFASEEAYKALEENISKRPTYPLMRESNLAISTLTDLGSREESFMSNFAEKIPVLGRGVRASGRAYSGFLNKLRADVFDDLVQKAESLGLNPTEDFELTDSISNFVNTATGRGNLGALEKAAPILNSVFFSPRLIASRLNLLNPKFYMDLDPFVRKEALKSLLTFAGTGVTVLGLAKAGGLDVGTDPRSADFGKIKTGNTRYDIWGGFQQYIRLAAQLITNQIVSTTSGKVMNLGQGYKPTTRKDILQRFGESKFSPIASFATGLLKGQTATGEPFEVTKEIRDRFIPLVIQDAQSLVKEKGFIKGLGIAPAIFGVGVQTYGGLSGIDSIDDADEKGAVTLYQYLKTINPEEANKYVEKLETDNPKAKTPGRLQKFKELEDMGLSEDEMRLVGTEYDDRAQRIIKKVNSLPTKEEKNDYLSKLDEADLLPDEVYELLEKAKDEGKLKAPKNP